MLTRSMFPRDIFSELERLQQNLLQSFDMEPSIRGAGLRGFPAMNIGNTAQTVELYAFAPGLDPARIDVSVDQNVLTIAGERGDNLSTEQEKATVHINERFAGSFRRVMSLPEDVDPDGISANYRDGVLHISIKRRQAAQPRRISVQ